MPDETVRILLVEDNPADAGLICDFLGDDPRYHVVHVARLSAALAQLVEGRFDAALLDLHLPDAEGLSTYVRLRERAPDLPIIVLSGERSESLALQAVAKGAQDYIVKGTLPPSALLRTLRFSIERSRADLLLRGYRAQAARDEKLTALGTLLAGVAHEVNNPLTYLRGSAELATSALDEALGAASIESARLPLQEAQSQLRMVILACERVEAFVNALRQTAPNVVDPAMPFDLDAMVDNALRTVSARTAHARVHREGSLGRPVRAQPGPIWQVVMHLLENAAEATATHRDPSIVVRTRTEAEAAVFEIENDGQVVDPKQVDGLFTPFFTTKETRRGLGLHGSEAVARANGGRLEFVPGPRTLFRLTLPWEPRGSVGAP